MRRVWRIVMFAFLPSCALSDSPVLAPEALVPIDARNVTRSPQGAWEQISFVVDRPYPDFAFADEQLGTWLNAGWKLCKSQEPGWSSFVDVASGPSRRIHQKTLHLAKGNELILLSGRYHSSNAEALKPSAHAEPESTTQYGMVIWMKGSPEEIKSALDSFRASCD
jgi:hypothetical protein